MRSLLTGNATPMNFVHTDQSFAALITGNIPNFSTPSANFDESAIKAMRASHRSVVRENPMRSSLRSSRETPMPSASSTIHNPQFITTYQKPPSHHTTTSIANHPLEALNLYYSHFNGLQVRKVIFSRTNRTDENHFLQ
jgi:hypothetical protein